MVVFEDVAPLSPLPSPVWLCVVTFTIASIIDATPHSGASVSALLMFLLTDMLLPIGAVMQRVNTEQRWGYIYAVTHDGSKIALTFGITGILVKTHNGKGGLCTHIIHACFLSISKWWIKEIM